MRILQGRSEFSWTIISVEAAKLTSQIIYESKLMVDGRSVISIISAGETSSPVRVDSANTQKHPVAGPQ